MWGQWGQDEDKQLSWIMSNRDGSELSANQAVTLWPKISFPGASPKRAKQHEHNESPPPEMSIIEPLVVNFSFLVFMPEAYYTAISPKTLKPVKPREKHFKNTLTLLSLSLLATIFSKSEEWDHAVRGNADVSPYFPRGRTQGRLDKMCSAKQQPNLHRELNQWKAAGAAGRTCHWETKTHSRLLQSAVAVTSLRYGGSSTCLK